MSGIDWSKAKEGYDVHILWGHSEHFYRIEGDRYVRDNGYYAVIEEAHREALAITFRPWGGDGLPPVGIECEVENEDLGGWDRVDKVLAHSSVNSHEVAVLQRGNLISYAKKGSFRPILTPEQIAADEREKEISEIAEILRGLWSSEREAAGFLLDAGYRKIEVKP